MSAPEIEAEAFELTVEVEVRACVQADLPGLEWGGLFTHHRELIQEAFSRQERGEAALILAVTEGGPVGQIWVDLQRVSGAGVLWAFRVIPWLEGCGIGTRLVAAAERFLRQRGYGSAEIRAETHNRGARRLYERLGYQVMERVQEEYAYTPPGRPRELVRIDEWILRKHLAPAHRAEPDRAATAGLEAHP